MSLSDSTPGDPVPHDRTPRDRMRRAGHRLPTAAWLWLLWVLLWGKVSPLVLVGGLLVAVTVVAAFPLPHLLPHTALRPWRAARLLGHLVADVFSSAVTVAWEALRHGPATKSAVIEVSLRVDTDFLIAATANLATLTPGTLVLEIDREHRLLYVHALPVRDRRAAEDRRREVENAERRVSLAVGPAGTERRPEHPPREEESP